MDELTPQELNKFLSEFLLTVRRKEDNEEYELNSLRTFFASFERHLKKNRATVAATCMFTVFFIFLINFLSFHITLN